MSKKAVQLSICGRVQGVGFRYSTLSAALKLGVSGWVRNEYDSTVTVLCEGDTSLVDAFIRWCRKGPPSAHVTGVEIKTVPYRGVYSRFSIEY